MPRQRSRNTARETIAAEVPGHHRLLDETCGVPHGRCSMFLHEKIVGRMLRLTTLLVLAGSVTSLQVGCGARGPTFGFQRDALRSQRVAEAYAPYRLPGGSVLSGNISLTNEVGEKVVAKNLVVRLTPATTFSRKVFADAQTEKRMPLSDLDEQGVVIWTGRTDGEGNFRFEGLPAGDYFVLCHVSWLADIDGENVERTALVGGEVTLQHSQHRTILLSPDHAHHAGQD